MKLYHTAPCLPCGTVSSVNTRLTNRVVERAGIASTRWAPRGSTEWPSVTKMHSDRLGGPLRMTSAPELHVRAVILCQKLVSTTPDEG